MGSDSKVFDLEEALRALYDAQDQRDAAVRERDEARAERDLILCQDHMSAGRRFDIKCVICRWDAAEQDAARLAESLRDWHGDCNEGCDEPGRPCSARDALAAHAERVGGGR